MFQNTLAPMRLRATCSLHALKPSVQTQDASKCGNARHCAGFLRASTSGVIPKMKCFWVVFVPAKMLKRKEFTEMSILFWRYCKNA